LPRLSPEAVQQFILDRAGLVLGMSFHDAMRQITGT
jgi:hypothetical protein